MQKEKLAAIGLVIIIIGAIVALIFVAYGEDILNNLFGKKESSGAIELGDCVDINYIGRYCSNGTIFGSSYNDTSNKTDGTPINIFVSLNKSVYPPEGYDAYAFEIDGLVEGLVGLKEGDNATIGPIPPEKAYGFKPKVGDIMNLTPLLEYTTEYRFIMIQENVSMPSEFEDYFGNGTTTLYTLREELHYVGEIIDSYSFWKNSSMVTGINETSLWIYVTPSTVVGENFTYSEANETYVTLTTYPENTSSISFINETIIKVTHTPEINTTINVSAYDPQYGLYPVGSYTIENITADKINVSTTDSTGNKTYMDFDRTITIQRNQTINITVPPIPGEYLEMFFSDLRSLDSNFKLSYLPLSDQTLCYEVEIEKVYKTS